MRRLRHRALHLAYCRQAWKELRGNLDPRHHPTADGAVKLIAHNGVAAEAKRIREAFRELTGVTPLKTKTTETEEDGR